ncbi:MAG: DNA gyrase subunit A [Alphaproteobacteria bacterium]|nr:DNA gyrase subunit A [Alphaproteobacteria bacterium]
MQRSYLDYAMSVIVSRAIPDVRDGLKPVHRRILYAMRVGGYDWSRPYRKSARIVGDVMGQFHPHGDSAIYDALVRMAQWFSMRLPLISGQGNFGSLDADPPAAMRYTEARLAQAAQPLLEDIDKDTVDFQLNYDESEREPTVLPARFPNLLVNGAGGIAVGMATNIPPHNLGEVVAATLAYLDDPEIGLDELMEIMPGPDFPTGALVMGRGGIRQAFATGRGSVIMRARHQIEERPGGREAIIVTDVPYQCNKAKMVERIAEVVNLKLIEGISDLRDESDRHGIRVVIELKRDAVTDVVLNQLFRFTPMQTSFGYNMLALNGGRPQVMPLKAVLQAFCRFREQVITRRTAYELGRARERANTLLALAVAVANLDDVIRLIREAPDPATARERLMARPWPAGDIAPLIALVDDGADARGDGNYRLSQAQAQAILDLRLHRLTGLEREKIDTDLRETVRLIEDYLDILGNRERVLTIMRDELAEVREKFDTPRRTEILDAEADQDDEDLIQREDMVITVSRQGYIKRVPLASYREQRRGGKGRAGMSTRDEDFVADVFVANTHAPVLFFSSRGMVYKLKVYRLPIGTPQARGKAMVNLLPLSEGETISTVLPLPEEDTPGLDEMDIVFATASGNVRRNKLSDFTNVMANGKIAMKLEEGDSLIGVALAEPTDHFLLATWHGKAIRFPVEDVRVFAGRASTGIRGIALAEGDRVISMTILKGAEIDTETRDAYLRMAAARRREDTGEVGEEQALDEARFEELHAAEELILSVADDGYGKRTSAYDYRVTRRGGKGIDLMDLMPGAGVVAAFPVSDSDGLVLVTNGGQLIRVPVQDIRIARRSTRGVRLFSVGEGERVVSVSRIAEE